MVTDPRHAQQMSDIKYVWRAMLLQKCYGNAFKLPSHALTLQKQGHLDHLAKTVVVFYPRGENVRTIKRLARQRVPCNISGHDHFDVNLMQETFGWSKGFYQTFYDKTNTLAPNIAIACTTKIWLPPDPCHMREVRVVNLIGYAFDCREQADYRHFWSHPEELMERMKIMWRSMFAAAKHFNVEHILCAKVGGGAFARYLPHIYPDGYDLLFSQSLDAVRCEPGNNVFDLAPLGHVPGIAFKIDTEVLSKTLFVNAWDMLSIVGNGNEGDASLDGCFGRSTAMGLLCWPVTNPHLTYMAV